MTILVEDTKYDDLDYCENVLEALENLEENHRKRNNLEQIVQEKIKRKEKIGKLLSLFLIPLVVVIGLVMDIILKISVRDYIIVLGTGLILYILELFWWNKRGKLKVVDSQKKEYRLALDRINSQSKQLLEQLSLASPRVATKYLSVDKMRQMMNYLEKKQASFLEEAIYMMELDIQNEKYNKVPASEENIVQEERNILQDLGENK